MLLSSQLWTRLGVSMIFHINTAQNSIIPPAAYFLQTLRVKPRPRGWLLEVPGVSQGQAERASSLPLQELLGPNQVSAL